ncbi:hypothetical protein VPH35_030009 [Triticum aestivum]
MPPMQLCLGKAHYCPRINELIKKKNTERGLADLISHTHTRAHDTRRRGGARLLRPYFAGRRPQFHPASVLLHRPLSAVDASPLLAHQFSSAEPPKENERPLRPPARSAAPSLHQPTPVIYLLSPALSPSAAPPTEVEFNSSHSYIFGNASPSNPTQASYVC